ncbi:neuronal tyrosine-phosphorylated phosphoinositide-3-kinase adapter 1 [Erpetoichthys calabaricus]|uniref:Neuronal tyrosine phosphorylated phosphoinositide-3-kinase adaptor 1 n=1 Tax=Erpetoichthys calabaricus TaxID=27687 RepID=A0A8C4X7J2_ERPCA|nr:neuronal tyrosine-phosphorylated phosphoinositide-3-kinase adapter 1 [Erpetoichthys calabaricus]
MSTGPTQDVAIELFLRDIEERGSHAHKALIARESQNSEMNLLYRKTRIDWRHRDTTDHDNKKSSSKDGSVTVGKVRDMASFRRHFRMGFMTMPASQEHTPHPCASSMAPRSQSCHSVGSMENGGEPHHPTCARKPPAKPKRHPSTRLSTAGELHGSEEGGAAGTEKKTGVKKSDTGEQHGRKIPPLKPKRAPNTQLSVSFDNTHPTQPLNPTNSRTISHQSFSASRYTPDSQHSQSHASTPQNARELDEEEPVYIEMVGDVFKDPSHSTATPDSDSDQSEAIYEEMKYPLPEDPGCPVGEFQNHGRGGEHTHHKSTKVSLILPPPPLPPHNSAPLAPKVKLKREVAVVAPTTAAVSAADQASFVHSQLSTSSASSGTTRAPTPFVFAKNSSCEIPAPFPNLLQHKPPLLAFPQPAASSSGISVQKSSKLGTVSTQTGQSGQPSSKLPVLQPNVHGKDQLQTASQQSSNVSSSVTSTVGPSSSNADGQNQNQNQQNQRAPDIKEQNLLVLGPAGRARSHSTPLPPPQSSQSSYLQHKADKDLPVSQSMKLGSHSAVQSLLPVLQQQVASGSTAKDKSVGVSTSQKSSQDRDKEKQEPSTGNTAVPSGRSATPLARPISYRSPTPHNLMDHPCSMLWTYPSAGLKRPPAYESLRGPTQGGIPKSSSASPAALPAQHKGMLGALSTCTRQQTPSALPTVPAGSTVGGIGDPKGLSSPVEEGTYWPMQRKMSFSRASKDSEKTIENAKMWNGSTDALVCTDKEEKLMGQSGIPVRTHGLDGTSGKGLARPGLPVPCQTFPACHRNGEFGRLGRSASTSGVRQASTYVQRQCSLPRDALHQIPGQSRQNLISQPGVVPHHFQSPSPTTGSNSPLPQHVHLHNQSMQCQPQAVGEAVTMTALAQQQRDGKLLEVIERKRCLCKEIKAHRRPERSLCKQDSMPILPSWRKNTETRKTGTPPCRRQQTVLWDTAI